MANFGPLSALIDLVLPPRCPVCGALVDGDDALCGECWPQMRFLSPPWCKGCGRPIETDFGGASDDAALCAPCLQKPLRFDRLRAATAYEEHSRTIVLKLKYGGRIGTARLIARHMERLLSEEKAGDLADALLVPVPLHRWRLWRRGFNQSALIADALAKRRQLSHCPDALLRTKATPPLKGKSRNQRKTLLAGAIAINPRRKAQLSGRNIILIDDVYTSGATGQACAHQLRRAGAASVTMLCWARVLREGETAGV